MKRDTISIAILRVRLPRSNGSHDKQRSAGQKFFHNRSLNPDAKVAVGGDARLYVANNSSLAKAQWLKCTLSLAHDMSGVINT